MNATALTTLPLSYSKACDTFRPRIGQGATIRAGLGGESFTNFHVPCAMPNGLVRELITEGRPASIKYRLRHAGFGESCRVDISNGDVVELSDDASREFVEKIPTTISDLGMNSADTALFPCSLGFHKCLLGAAVNFLRHNSFSSGQNSKFLESKVDSDPSLSIPVTDRNLINFYNDVEEPVPLAISGKVCAVFYLARWQRAGVEDTESIASASEGITVPPHVHTAHRNPAEGVLASVTQIGTPFGASRTGVLLANAINRICQKPQFFAATSSKVIQVKASQPLFIPLDSVFLSVVAIVPDEVYRAGLLVQEAIEGLNAVAVHDMHIRNYAPQQKGIPA